MSRKKIVISKNFSDRIIELMRKFGFGERDQGKFANKIGISPSYFSEVLNLKTGPSFNLIYGISNKFPEVNMDWILSGKGNMIRGSGRDVYNNVIEGSCRAAENISEFKSRDDSEISGLLEMTRGILTSGTEYSMSLGINIRAFHSAVCMGREIGRLKERVDLLESVFAQCAQKNSAIRQGDPPEKKDDLIKMRGTSSL